MYWEWLILNKYPSIKSDKIIVDVSDMGAIINTRFEWKSNKSRIYFRVSDKNLLKHIKSATKKESEYYSHISNYTQFNGVKSGFRLITDDQRIICLRDGFD